MLFLPPSLPFSSSPPSSTCERELWEFGTCACLRTPRSWSAREEGGGGRGKSCGVWTERPARAEGGQPVARRVKGRRYGREGGGRGAGPTLSAAAIRQRGSMGISSMCIERARTSYGAAPSRCVLPPSYPLASLFPRSSGFLCARTAFRDPVPACTRVSSLPAAATRGHALRGPCYRCHPSPLLPSFNSLACPSVAPYSLFD